MKNENNQEKKQTLLSKVGNFAKDNQDVILPALGLVLCTIGTAMVSYKLGYKCGANDGGGFGIAAVVTGLNEGNENTMELIKGCKGFTFDQIAKGVTVELDKM